MPIIINCRDRVTDLRALVAWLERAGHERITLLDNASTYEPLLDYLRATPHTVVRLTANMGSRALWHANLVPSERFVYTDPDIVPTEECPLDVLEHLHELLRFHEMPKVGLGLKLDDVATEHRDLAWEHELVDPSKEVAPDVFNSLVDTTFALYRGHAEFTYLALRTGAPYLARHMPWYRDELDEEHRYYVAHAMRGREGTNLSVSTDGA